MRLTYTPEDGDKQNFSFDPETVTAPEAELLETMGGNTWPSFAGWKQAFWDNRIRARRAAVWLILHRDDASLKFEGFAPMANQIGFSYEIPELLAIRKTWQDVDTDDAREQLRAIDVLLIDQGWTPADGGIDAAPEAGEAEPADPKPRSSRASRPSRRKTPGSVPATDSGEPSTDGPSQPS